MKIRKTYLIDDDEIFTTLTEIQMKKVGCFGVIQNFENGEIALEQIKQDVLNDTLPDFILLDINMPLMDGWQFLQAFEKLNIVKKMAIFMATSSIDPSDIEQSKHFAIVSGFYSKPINAQKINEIVAHLDTM